MEQKEEATVTEQEKAELLSFIKSEEFGFFTNEAYLSRELWWIPLGEIREMRKRNNVKEIYAYRCVAADFEEKNNKNLAALFGNDVTNMFMQTETEDERTLAIGKLCNNIALKKLLERTA